MGDTGMRHNSRDEAAATTATDPAEVRRLRRTREKRIAVFGAFAVLLLASLFLAARAEILGEWASWAAANIAGESEAPPTLMTFPVVDPFPKGQKASLEKALNAKALYLTMDSAGTVSSMITLMDFVRDHDGLNSFVIDVKDNSGRVPTVPPDSIPALPGRYPHYPALVGVLHDLDYYMIARIVAFQDPYRARMEPERAIRNADGSLWRAKDGMLWLNPYDRKNWEYVKDVALWALDMGFDEIQLDYVRFPDSSRGMERTSSVLMPGHEEYETRGDAIAAFLDYMDEAIGERAYLAADIFGFVTIAADDMGIGQKLEQIADCVDFICPMVYPSHYFNAGIYGFQLPEAHPYEVVGKAMDEAQARTAGLRSKIRPWLQDFSLRVRYGPAEVRGQIDAVFEHGIDTYMLWNPANRFTDGVKYTK